MKIFKNRFIALILAILILVSSSLLSVHIKLNREFSKISNDFYNGVLVNGKRDLSIHSQLVAIGRLAEDMAALAEKNGIDVSEFKDNIEYFNRDILTMHEDISYVHYLYKDILDDILELGYALNDMELSRLDEMSAVNALEEILKAKENIENSAYNERVRKYINSLGFPMNLWVELSGAELPEYFA